MQRLRRFPASVSAARIGWQRKVGKESGKALAGRKVAFRGLWFELPDDRHAVVKTISGSVLVQFLVSFTYA
jgi:hypothetical protein